MRTVYASRDNGFMAALTRWQPRRVFCTKDAEHEGKEQQYVVKFRRGTAGTAAVISELVCNVLLQAGGISTLEGCLVEVSEKYASANVSLPYRIEPGAHWGTILMEGVFPGPPTGIDQLSSPQELVDIWVFDTWFCNIDRNVYGNLLLKPKGETSMLIAADQSDCFQGSGSFCQPGWSRAFLNHTRPAEATLLAESIFAAGQLASVHMSLERLKRARKAVGTAVQEVPQAWYDAVRLEKRELAAALDERAEKVPSIVEQGGIWAKMSDATKGGHVLF